MPWCNIEVCTISRALSSSSRRKADSAPPGSGNSPEDRFANPSTELAVQFGCLSARIRINPGPEGPLRAAWSPPQPMAAGRSARRAVRRRRLGNRLGGHDAVAGPGPDRQDTLVAQEMKPGRGNQSRQLLQQFHRRQQEMAGPIRPRRFEREGKMVGIENAQTPSRQGRPGHVAAVWTLAFDALSGPKRSPS